MPQKLWGSRYDPLFHAPTSPVTRRTEVATATPTPHSPTSSPIREGDGGPSTPATVKREKISHDIFVGSLPSGPDVVLGTLNQSLTAHLSRHGEVKSVKVVRDRKGGVCAFVQCENAATADSLLRKLQEPDEPMFDGRRLRYEPAHAFRTLLISYRTPLHLCSSSGLDQSISNCTTDGALHDAMRISMLDNSKRYDIRYDDDARADPPLESESDNTEKARSDRSPRGSGLLISPLKFDDETLRKIVSAFGSIEYFGLFDTKTKTTKDGVNAAASADAHCGPRSEGMDTSVFEVKWEHRDDCMNASMTLRFVPHLVVTWAHLAYTDLGDVSGYRSRISSPAMSPTTRFPSYPRSRTQSRSHLPVEHQRSFYNMPPVVPGFGLDGSQFNDGSQSPDRHWAPSYSSPNLRGSSFPLSGHSLAVGPPAIFQPSTNWNTVDFPPLHDRNVAHPAKKSVKPLDFAWAPRESGEAESEGYEDGSATSLSPTSSLSVQPSTPNAARSLMSPAIDGIASPSQSSGPSPDDHPCLELGQDLTMPPTPDFTTSSITPVTPKTGNSFPRTPPSVVIPFHTSEHGTFAKEHKGYRDGGSVDSCCIWIGGLDESWDRERVQKVFSEYGDVNEVTLVQPKPPATAAFAFVKYETAEAAVKAVKAKDRCIYGSRAITVRLRELSRGNQKSLNRGRSYTSKNADNRPGDVYRHGTSPQGHEPRRKPNRSQSRSSHLSTKLEELEFPSLNGTRTTHDAVPEERSVSAASSVSPATSIVNLSAGAGSVAPYPLVVPPQPWMQQYQLSYGYSAPYSAHYMGYPVSTPQYQYTPGVGDDMNPRSQYHWAGSGYLNKIGIQHSQSSSGDPQTDQDHAQTQPPLRPTHLIKDEHGGITAVYPPEALNQYLTSSGSPQSDHSPPPMSAPQPAQAAQSHPPPSSWGAYPQPTSQVPMMYPYPYGPSVSYVTPLGGQYMQPGSWTQNGAPPAFLSPAQHQPLPNTQQFQAQVLPHPQALSTPPPYLLPSVSSGSLSSSSSFRGGYPTSASGNHADSRVPQVYGNKRFGWRDQAMGHGHGAHHFRHPNPHAPSGYPTVDPRSSPGRGRGMPMSNSYGDHMSAGAHQHTQMRQLAPYSIAST